MRVATAQHSVLLVDDEVEFLQSMAQALRRRGFETLLASNAGEALSILHRERVDVAVLDVKMPGMQGDDLFRLIQGRWPELPVILLTGHGDVQQAFRTTKEGVFEYLTKPCSVEDLTRALSAALGTAPEPAEQQVAREAPIRVLLVDDEPEFVDSLGQALRRRGLQVTGAGSAEEAQAQLEGEAADVLVLDLKMPGIGGLEFLRRLKSSHPGIEVIVLTGHPTYATANEAMRVGAFDFLIKPQDPTKLAQLIREAFRHGRQATEQRYRQQADAAARRQRD